MNATFPAMMHSISILSPVEDLDEQELSAWGKMLDLEGKVEETDLLVSQMTLSSGYCFTMSSLLTSSLLFATVVMVLSMSAAMTCLRLRSSTLTKEANLY